MIRKYFRQFIKCHQGAVNKLIHALGFGLIGIGIVDRNLLFVLTGGVTQELGHFYEYYKTKDPKQNPLHCIRPQSIFAYPIFALIILYVLLVK